MLLLNYDINYFVRNSYLLYDGLTAVQQAALEFGDGVLDNLGYAYKDINNDWRITK